MKQGIITYRIVVLSLLFICACRFLGLAQETGIIAGPIQNPANGHLYYLLGHNTWARSQAEAQKLCGNLVTINDAEEQAWLVSTFSNYGGVSRPFWIGYTDQGQPGDYRWISGETSSYTNWAPGEPNSLGVENYVHFLLGSGLWNNLRDTSYDSVDNYPMYGVAEVVPPPRPVSDVFDDFDLDIDSSQWSAFGGTAQANGYGESVSGTNSLWFGGSGSRFAATRPLNTLAGGVIHFYLRFANGTDATWEQPELPGEGVVMEYSLDATNWLIIARYETPVFFAWTPVQLAIPDAAKSVNSFFRWRQLANSGSSLDHWALDNVQISAPPSIICGPQSQIAHAGSAVVLSVSAVGASLGYQWFFNGTKILGTATNATLTISDVQPFHAGGYQVVVSNLAGSVTSVVATLTYSPVLVPTGSFWKYFDQGLDLGTNWVAPDYNDSSWLSGPAQLGYGDGDEATVVSFGPDANNKFTTTYFRRAFNVPEPTLFTNYLLRLLVDDGAVVYLNGAEVKRINLPQGPISYSTQALSTNGTQLGADEENSFFQTFIIPAKIIRGTNILAIEVHQANSTSTDISFDLDLAGNAEPTNLLPKVAFAVPLNGNIYSAGSTLTINCVAFDLDGALSKVEFFADTNKLAEFVESATRRYTFNWMNVPLGDISLTAVATDSQGARTVSVPVNINVLSGVKYGFVSTGAFWKYLDNGSDQGTNWVGINFDDSGWPAGRAQLGYGDSDEATVLSYGPSDTNKFTTSYFRHAFYIEDASLFPSLAARLLRDDGAVVYLNGVEFFRSNLPTNAPIRFDTFANSAIGEPEETQYFPTTVPAQLLRNGTNILAVEIHQGNLTSSDISFDLEFGVSGVSGTPLTFVNGRYSALDLYVAANSALVELTTSFSNGVMLYTLDGSQPTVDSFLYNGSFTLTKTTVIRAIAYKADFSIVVEAEPVQITVLPMIKLTATVNGPGSVIFDPQGGAYVSNTVVTATAVPDAGWVFLYWLGDTEGTNAISSIPMVRDKSVQAIFGTRIGTTVAGSGSVSLNPPGGLHSYGTVVRLTAIPEPGNFFALWGNAASGNTNPLLFTVTNANPTISCLFSALSSNQFSLAVLENGRGEVSVSPLTNRYFAGQSVTLTAMPDPGQSFLGWSGSTSGAENPLVITMDGSKIISANFTKRPRLVMSVGVFGESEFRFTLSGESDERYEIQVSMDLNTWTPLAVLTNSFGEVQFDDFATSSFSRRFYRAVAAQ